MSFSIALLFSGLLLIAVLAIWWVASSLREKSRAELAAAMQEERERSALQLKQAVARYERSESSHEIVAQGVAAPHANLQRAMDRVIDAGTEDLSPEVLDLLEAATVMTHATELALELSETERSGGHVLARSVSLFRLLSMAESQARVSKEVNFVMPPEELKVLVPKAVAAKALARLISRASKVTSHREIRLHAKLDGQKVRLDVWIHEVRTGGKAQPPSDSLEVATARKSIEYCRGELVSGRFAGEPIFSVWMPLAEEQLQKAWDSGASPRFGTLIPGFPQ